MNENNAKISSLLRFVAIAYTLQNVNKFRIIAYQKAAEVIQYLDYDIFDLYKKGELDTVQGLGESLRGHITEYFKDPKHSYLIKTIHEIPESVYVLMNIPGIGPKKAFKLVQAFHLDNPKTAVEDLKKIAVDGKIAELETFGKKSEEEILKSIEIYFQNQNKEKRYPYPIAYELAMTVVDYMRELKSIHKIEVLGSLRRKQSTIGDIDMAITCDEHDKATLIHHFVEYPGKIGIESEGDKKASIIAANGMGVDLRVTDDKTFGSMLQYFTGSKAHNVLLREYSLKQNKSLSEYGIKNTKTDGVKIFDNEKDFYNYLGLDYIPPELRLGTDEIEKAKNHTLPKLIEEKDLKGDFHVHSSYPIEPSHDLGSSTYEELLDRALELEYSYIGFADHNPSVSNHSEAEIINIMKKRYDVLQKIKEDKKYKSIDIYVGLEVDILPDGKLALPEKAFEYVDYLVVSIHSRFTLSSDESTKRILNALNYPKVKIFGHPTGRLIEKRNGVDADWRTVFALCSEKNIALEINASPYRLDLPDNLVRDAKNIGCQFIIDSDTHGIAEMNNLPYGISVARRGGCESKNIVNAGSQKEFKDWISFIA